MLAFVVKRSGGCVEICFDRHGMKTLMDAMERALAEGDHLHLLSPSAGGRALDEASPWGEAAVHEVIVTSADDE